VVDLVNQKLLGLASQRVNVHGGAVALGEPPAAKCWGERGVVLKVDCTRIWELCSLLWIGE
jgi:hypothetical protein